MAHDASPTGAVPADHDPIASGADDTFGIDPGIYARRWQIHSVLCVSLVAIVAAVSSLNVAIPTIIEALEPSPTQTLWIVDSYALVFAGLLLPAGAVGDRFGRKKALQIGIVIFGTMALVASFANSANALIAARAVMGIGAALIMPATLSIITNVFPPHERAKAIAAWAGLSGAGGALGPLLSGLILKADLWWGAVFLINVPIAILLFSLVALRVPESKDPSGHALDPVGVVLSIVTLGSLVFGIIEAPEYGWSSARVLAALGLSLVAGLGFVAYESRTAQPMLDPRLFRFRGFSVGALTITCAFFCMFGTFYALTLYLQFVKGYSPLGAALRTLPQAVVMVLVAPRSPRLVAKIGVHNNVRLGFATLAVAYLIMSRFTVDTPYWVIMICLVLLAVGMAVMTAPTSAVIVGSLPLAKAGVGSAVNDVTREVGGVLGIALIGSFLSTGYASKIVDRLAGSPIPDGPRHAIEESIGVAFGVVDRGLAEGTITNDQAEGIRAIARESFITGNRNAFLAAFGVAVIGGLIVGTFMPKDAGDHRPAAASS